MTDDRKKTDPSAIVIPFGKHKGATVAELLARDPGYADWVTAQGWVAERFAELHAAILTRGAGTDDTPEHNALQARFLDPDFRLAVAYLLMPAKQIQDDREELRERLIGYGEDKIRQCEQTIETYTTGWGKHEPEAETRRANARQGIFREAESIDALRNAPFPIATVVTFEEHGVDVLLEWGFNKPGIGTFRLELKPTMGDDYPAVMRQMKRLGARTLIMEHYTGRGVAEPQIRQMFEASGLRLLFLQEIEEAMRSPTPSRSGERG